jgi:hypothetical protein
MRKNYRVDYSLPIDIIKAVEKLSQESNIIKSRIVKLALEDYLRKQKKGGNK